MAPWQEFANTGFGAVESFEATAFGDGIHLVAGQPSVDTFEPTIWLSADALHWQRAVLPNDPRVFRINQVVAVQGGFVALAEGDMGDNQATLAYTSSEGREWTPAGSFLGRTKLASVIGGTQIAVGTVDHRAVLWSSIDVLEWTVSTEPSAFEAANGAIAIYGSGDATWILRSDDPGEDGSNTNPVEVWRTDDGATWSKVTDLPDSISVSQAAMAFGPKGWVITALRVTFAGPSQAVYDWYAWSSADGVDWRSSQSPPEHTEDVLAYDDGFIAFGGDYGGCCAADPAAVDGVTWTSADGTSWQRLPRFGWRGRVIEGVFNKDDSLVGIGIDWTLQHGETGVGVAWTAQASDLIQSR